MPALSPRGRIVRDALVYTPVFVIAAVILLLMFLGVMDRAIVGMVLLALVVFLFGYQSVQSLRDLNAVPRSIEGAVARRWTKRDGFVVKSYYVTVARGIYRIPVESYLDLHVGDIVRIAAYPHTGMVVSVERTGRALEAEKPVGPVEAQGRMRTLRTARSTPRARRAAGDSPGTAAREGETPRADSAPVDSAPVDSAM